MKDDLYNGLFSVYEYITLSTASPVTHLNLLVAVLTQLLCSSCTASPASLACGHNLAALSTLCTQPLLLALLPLLLVVLIQLLYMYTSV